MSSSNFIDYSVNQSDNVSNPFKNNKRPITLKNIFERKGLLVIILLIIIYLIIFIAKLVSISKKNKEISSLSTENSDLDSKIASFKSSITYYQELTSPIQSEVNSLTDKRNSLLLEQNKLEDEYKYLRQESKLSSETEINILQSKISEFSKDLQKAKDLNAHYKETNQELAKEYENLQKEIQRIKEQKQKPDTPPAPPAEEEKKQYPLNQIDSSILQRYPSLTENKYFTFKTKNIYRASRDGFSPQVFHQYCDYADATLTIVLTTRELVIVGFTTQSWGGSGFKRDENSFLYNLNTGKTYPIRNFDQAIYCSSTLFPVFGNGDFIVGNPFNTDFPRSYGFASSVGLELTNGLSQGEIMEFEVFAVKK